MRSVELFLYGCCFGVFCNKVHIGIVFIDRVAFFVFEIFGECLEVFLEVCFLHCSDDCLVVFSAVKVIVLCRFRIVAEDIEVDRVFSFAALNGSRLTLAELLDCLVKLFLEVGAVLVYGACRSCTLLKAVCGGIIFDLLL